jgi:hypothetical protein
VILHIEKGELLACFIFNYEASFHVKGEVNGHSVRVSGTEDPHVTLEHEGYSPKVNVFFAISKERVYGPSSFEKNTCGGIETTQIILAFQNK